MLKPNCCKTPKTANAVLSYSTNNSQCPNNPDLYLLRDAAADERRAIADYLDCALTTPLRDLFFDVAEDEMQHFEDTMKLISTLDPIQAQQLHAAGLDFLTMTRPADRPKWTNNTKAAVQAADVQVAPPTKKDMCAIECLTRAIQDELCAINKYQRYMNEAQETEVKEHFCDLMNAEKEHVAEFTAALFQLTHEPLS
jgi:rubrerythrin